MTKKSENTKPAQTPSLNIAGVSGSYGYFQKGNRYFFKIGATTHFNMGFKSKNDCDKWIQEKRNQYGLDWRCGFMVKFVKFQTPFILVDRKGNEVKAF